MDRDLQRIYRIKCYCEDILEAVEYLGRDYNEYLSNKHYANSISLSLLQIGEHFGSVTEEFKDAHRKDVPWVAIRGMRNRLAHSYDDMDKKYIWESAVTDIPMILAFCERVLTTEAM